MSEQDLAIVRAEGIFQEMVDKAKKELIAKNRSKDYCNTFWLELEHLCHATRLI